MSAAQSAINVIHKVVDKPLKRITFNRMTSKIEPKTKPRGRPALPEDERTVPGSVRLTPARWEKLRRLGVGWLGKAIDRAREPGDQK